MARKSKPLTVKRYISFDGPNGEYKAWEDCTAEEIERFQRATTKKAEKVLAQLISQRLEAGQPIDIFG